jgi:hypothetical protein
MMMHEIMVTQCATRVHVLDADSTDSASGFINLSSAVIIFMKNAYLDQILGICNLYFVNVGCYD